MKTPILMTNVSTKAVVSIFRLLSYVESSRRENISGRGGMPVGEPSPMEDL